MTPETANPNQTAAIPAPAAEGSLARLPADERPIYAPILNSSWRFYLLVTVLLTGIMIGLYAYIQQLRFGLEVTDMSNTVSWGLYISTFVFFIGISHAGTLISAILRVTQAGWRKPITRMAEAITVFALLTGALFPLLDMGRPDRVLFMIQFAKFESAITWDFLSISTYLAGSMIYLYLPMIPDLAACRDQLTDAVWWKRRFYTIMALGWTGTKRQKKFLDRGITIMMISIIPVAVSVHTVVSYIFAMTLRPGWNSPIFGPLFVAGAIYSGIATLLIAMWLFRKFYKLEHILKTKHFINLALLMLAMDLIMVYFTINEFLVGGFGGYVTEESELIASKFTGEFAMVFWAMIIVSFVIPGFIIALPWTRKVGWIIVASIFINVGMFFERILIVVPSLTIDRFPYHVANYFPSWHEIAIVFGGACWFILLFVLFPKIFPIISVWELKEDEEGGDGAEPGATSEPAPAAVVAVTTGVLVPASTLTDPPDPPAGDDEAISNG